MTIKQATSEFPQPLYQNEVKSSAFKTGNDFRSHANKTYFRKKGFALGLILKVRDFGTRKWAVAAFIESAIQYTGNIYAKLYHGTPPHKHPVFKSTFFWPKVVNNSRSLVIVALN